MAPVLKDEGRGCECQHTGTFADTVTGSTGAEVIALGTVIGIIGATAAKDRWQQLPPWPPVAGSRVDPVAEREPGSTRLRVVQVAQRPRQGTGEEKARKRVPPGRS